MTTHNEVKKDLTMLHIDEKKKKIKDEVIGLLTSIAGMDINKMIDERRKENEKTAEDLFLKDDLLLSTPMIKALAPLYTKRLQKYIKGAVVTMTETQKKTSSTVSGVIMLLWSKLPNQE